MFCSRWGDYGDGKWRIYRLTSYHLALGAHIGPCFNSARLCFPLELTSSLLSQCLSPDICELREGRGSHRHPQGQLNPWTPTFFAAMYKNQMNLNVPSCSFHVFLRYREVAGAQCKHVQNHRNMPQATTLHASHLQRQQWSADVPGGEGQISSQLGISGHSIQMFRDVSCLGVVSICFNIGHIWKSLQLVLAFLMV